MVTSFWRNRRVLITGHTGFKGGWLCIWLRQLGAVVWGYSLAPPTVPNLFSLARIAELVHSRHGDVRHPADLAQVLGESQPEVIFHLAAQPLVLGGYSDPAGTFDINVMGTVHLLQAVRATPAVRAVVNVTTDKCYENHDRGVAFSESDPLGGTEPYGGSKACSEVVTQSFRQAFFDATDYAEHRVAIATARAGNVIGGGDWGENRLLPDIVRSFQSGQPALIRKPESTRPWQHVLEPLSGYLKLAQQLVNRGPTYNGAWNFGPRPGTSSPVSWIASRSAELWGDGARWERDLGHYPPEAHLLQLDCSKARNLLGWEPRLTLEQSLDLTIGWYRDVAGGADALQLCELQIDQFARESAA